MIRMVQAVALVCGLCLAAGSASADEPTPMPASALEEAERTIRPFLLSIQNNRVPEGLTGLFAGSAMESQTAPLAQLAGQVTTISALLGPLQDWTLRDAVCSSGRFCRVRYIMNFQTGALGVWIYTYRNPNGRWITQTVLTGTQPEYFFDL